ncbi:lipase/acylhydrolase [Rhodopirellula maiorica SM1]|uniref:Lipase/acylhydrolase n=1 Tax=Rhodopirellula maiorica SM1 TaxID=1265738 RepID=M5RAZ6_9BACT|nr:lipase/acylhydrolase [Rhodopirellula maiorica SM1]
MLLTIAILTIGGVFGYIEFYLARPIGGGPAGPRVDTRAFQQIWSEEPIQIIGVGDSITAGLGAKSPSHSFFNRVIKNPDDEFPELRGVCLSAVLPNLKTENFAISGSESQTHLDVIQNTIPVYHEARGIVLMTSGGNDLIHSYGRSAPRECAMYSATLQQAQPWIANFRTRLATMFDEIEKRFPLGCEIFIADIYDPTDGVGDAPSIFLPAWPDGLAIHAQYNQVIREVAQTRDHVHVVDLYQTFLGHGSHCRQFWRANYDASDPHYWFFTNIEDPNDRGYDAIRRVFLNAIVRHSRLAPKFAQRPTPQDQPPGAPPPIVTSGPDRMLANFSSDTFCDRKDSLFCNRYE